MGQHRLVKKTLLRRQVSGIKALRLLAKSHPRYARRAPLADQIEATLAAPEPSGEDIHTRISA
jgi:hypothetical protein